MNARSCLALAAIALALAVACGAFGAHALKSRLSSEQMATFHTAVQYHFWHALGLLAVGLLWLQRSDLAWVAGLLLLGLVLFCGSLYLLALTGMRWLGAITPFGGVAFIAGWLVLAWRVWKS